MVGKAQLNLDKVTPQRAQSKKTDDASKKEFKDALKKTSEKKERKEDGVAAMQSESRVHHSSAQTKSVPQQESQPTENIHSVSKNEATKIANNTVLGVSPQNTEITTLDMLMQNQAGEGQMIQKLGETIQPMNVEPLNKQMLNSEFNLEGFTAVKPQAVNLKSELLNASQNTESVDTVLSSFGNDISKLNEILQNSNPDAGSQDQLTQDQSLSDLLTANQTKVKEGGAQFNQILNNKVATPMMNESVQQANVDNIIQHARSVVKDGGGEMQIQLTPDGLGTVDLRVDVKNGQVNVEILADNKMTKTMFESGLNDIKGALEAQNLRVETVKVDISGDMQKHFSESQLDMMDREFARGFLGQFRDDRAFFRNQILSDRLEGVPSDSKGPEGISPAYQRLNSNNTVQGQRRLNIFA